MGALTKCDERRAEPRHLTEAEIMTEASDTERMAEMMAEDALRDAQDRHRPRGSRYDVKVQENENGTVTLLPSAGGEVVDMARRLNAFGTPSAEFAAHMVGQLATATRSPSRRSPNAVELNAGLASVDSIRPENEMEAMLAVQMYATHDAAMEMLDKAKRSDSKHLQECGSLAVKLLRTYTAQIEALSKIRRGGEQKVRVEHVHVYPGGQAVVGDVTVNASSDPVGKITKA